MNQTLGDMNLINRSTEMDNTSSNHVYNLKLDNYQNEFMQF